MMSQHNKIIIIIVKLPVPVKVEKLGVDFVFPPSQSQQHHQNILVKGQVLR